MADVDDSVEIKSETLQPVKVRMHQGESSGQPVYSNIVSVQSGQQDVVMLDFGFLDPKTMIALNHAAKSGGKIPESINAKMSCRIAINPDAAYRLARQLEQLLNKKTEGQSQHEALNRVDQVNETGSSTSEELNDKTDETKQSGFRFPWSKKK